jgi:hypothetical protein
VGPITSNAKITMYGEIPRGPPIRMLSRMIRLRRQPSAASRWSWRSAEPATGAGDIYAIALDLEGCATMPTVDMSNWDRFFNFKGGKGPYPHTFDIDPRHELCAVYFPAEITDSNEESSYQTLKRATLLFDRVFVIVPELVLSDHFNPFWNIDAVDDQVIRETERFQSLEYTLWRERVVRVKRFLRQTKSAHDAGILTYVNPSQIIDHTRQLKTHFYALPEVTTVPADEIDDYRMEVMFHSVLSDLRDAEFRSLISSRFPHDPRGMAVFKDQGEINWLSMLGAASPHEEDVLRHISTYTGPDTILPPPCVGFDGVVSPALGVSVILAHVMTFCINNPVYPLTDSSLFLSLLYRKLNRALPQSTADRDGTGSPPYSKPSLSHRVAGLGLEVINLELPRLNFRSFDEVLTVRAEHRDELRRFRLELAKFSDLSSTALWSPDFHQHCVDVATTIVGPACRELEERLRKSRNKILLQAFKTTRTASPVVPLVGSLLAGIPLLYSLAISAGLVAAESVAEVLMERRDIRAGSGLTYLLDLKRHL